MNKNKCFFNLLTIITAALLSICTISCGDDNPVSTPPPVPDDGNEQTNVVSNQDPEGTVVINMNNGANNNWYNIGIGNDIHIDAAYNFVGYNSGAEFASVGEISGLSKITSFPTTGWAKSAAVVPGTGYVARYRSSSAYPYTYARLFVVENMISTSGGIMGATVKYQSPFEALPIELDVTSMEFSYEASSKRIKLKQWVGFDITEKPEWCTVTQYNDEIEVTVSENLTAEQRSGNIILKNNVNSVTVNVVQLAPPPISLNATALEFTYVEETKKLILEQYVKVTIADKPEWCTVTQYNNEIEVSVSENFTAEQRTGIIVLKNSVNSITVNVVQQASPYCPSGSGTLADPYNVPAAVNKCLEIGTNVSTEKYYVKGIVDEEYIVDRYGNATFDLVATEGTTVKIKAYRAQGANDKKLKEGYKIPKGAIAIVCGPLVNYRAQTPEIERGFIVSINGQTPLLDGDSSSDDGSATVTELVNGNFESWVSNALPTGWQSASAASSATLAKSTDAHGGSYSCNVNGGGALNKRLASQEITLPAGSYNFSFYAKATTSNKAQVRPGYAIVENGSINSSSGYKYGSVIDVSNNGWTLVSHNFELTAETVVCLFVVNIKTSNYSSGEDVLVDDAMLTKR